LEEAEVPEVNSLLNVQLDIEHFYRAYFYFLSQKKGAAALIYPLMRYDPGEPRPKYSS